ncbi:CASP-like protein 10-like [Trifolium pratense]|uniref:CASP-like protein n=1 Tax=Trifolium pratense TaxID=57577 RepID=A0A2K3LB19_TRIPR|nr:CASP-like protein 10-like [Trifolium pratense]
MDFFIASLATAISITGDHHRHPRLHLARQPLPPFQAHCRLSFIIIDSPATMPVLAYIILSAGASTMEVVYLAENGDSAILGSSACGSFGQFCHKITASVALVCYVLLSLISSYKLFSKFDVPASSPAATGTNQ